MVRTQVLLTEEQMRAVRKIAAERGTSMAGVIRESVERLLEERERKDRWARSMEVIGKFSSGLTDVSVNHDKYLAEAYS